MPAPLISNEARAQIVADAVGKISDGDPRKRVFDIGLTQIRAAHQQGFEQGMRQRSNFYAGSKLAEQP